MAPVGGELLLFGGYDQEGTNPSGSFADTWTWNGSAWTQVAVTGPSARFSSVMATP